MKIRVTVLEAGGHALRVRQYDRSVKGALAGQPVVLDIDESAPIEIVMDGKLDVTLTPIPVPTFRRPV
jgi:hypothetical protein